MPDGWGAPTAQELLGIDTSGGQTSVHTEEIPEGAAVTQVPESTHYMISKLLPEIVDKLIQDGRHYGGSNHRILGLAGQFSDIWRKIGPLKRQMWDGEEPVRESTREILMDLVGHALLSIEMLDRGDPKKGVWVGEAQRD